MRSRQHHTQAAEPLSPGTELTGGDAPGHAIKDDSRQKLGGGVLPGNGQLLVQIPAVDFGEQLPQHHGGPADVDHQAVGIEHVAAKSAVDDEGGTVLPLGRTEDLTAEAVGDHDLVPNAEAIPETLFGLGRDL